jgi:hypothetical protein
MSRPDDRLSRRQERQLVKAGKRLFAEQFPNPDRIGCPSQDVLKAMAFRRPSAAGREYPVDHLTMCSPCFRQYSQYRAQAQFRAGARVALIAASIVLVVGALLWFAVGRSGVPGFRGGAQIAQQPQLPLPFQNVTLDLRPFASSRGEQLPNGGQPRLVIPRGRLRIALQLPVGADEGPYAVVLLGRSGQRVVSAQGQARLLDHVTTLEIEADLRSRAPGPCTLRIRRLGSSGQDYPATIK